MRTLKAKQAVRNEIKSRMEQMPAGKKKSYHNGFYVGITAILLVLAVSCTKEDAQGRVHFRHIFTHHKTK